MATMELLNLWYFRIDSFFCSQTQLPSTLLSNISHKTTANYVARLRSYTLLGILLEIIGYFLITFSFFHSQSLWTLSGGISLKIIGAMVSSKCQNLSGVTWSLELQNYLKNLKTHGQEIQSILTNAGCSENEISSLSGLPSEVYQTEINSYQRSCLLNIGIPIACGLALLLNGEILTSVIIILLGLLSFPIGEHFFREHTFRNESQLRIGRSAQMSSYIREVYNDHIGLTTRINFLSQIPLIIFCFRFLWGGGSQLLAVFFGLTQGLIGLSGTLAFQRLRVSALRTTDVAKHLISILTSNSFIISPSRWLEHSLSSQTSPPSNLKGQFLNGVVLLNFAAQIELQGRKLNSLPPINLEIPDGGIAILQAPSGFGKSTFLLALLHLIEHSGEIYFVSEGNWINIHSMTQKNVESSFFFLREDCLEKNARLLDLFKDPLQVHLKELKSEMDKNFGKTLTELAWNASDNLIEQELKNIEGGKQSLFSRDMLTSLKMMRTKRIQILSNILLESEGNLVTSRIHPERVFSSLSSGEKRRILCLIAYETAKTNCFTRLIILDEPLTHLDTENMEYQIKNIQKIQRLPHPPAILLISHHFISKIKDALNNVQTINLHSLNDLNHHETVASSLRI